MRLSDVAGAVPVEIARDGEFHALGLLSYDDPGLLVSLYEADFIRELLGNPRVSCVITSPELAPSVPAALGLAIASSPEQAFYDVHSYLLWHTDFYGQDVDTEISSTASVHATAFVATRNVRIGQRVIIEPHATIMEGSILGDDVVVRAGSVIGAEGFHPKRFGDRLVMIPHVGGVWLKDAVAVLSGSVVCRSVFGGSTEVGEDSKIGTRVSISHHVRIGRRCRIGASASILGSAVLEDDVWVGPGAILSNQVRVGAKARVSLGSVVVRDLDPGEHVTGNFAVGHQAFLLAHKRLMD